MTINVTLAASEATILGCDSLSSINEFAFFPFRNPECFVVDENGEPIEDEHGRSLIAIDFSQVSANATTSVMGGVQKMFLLFEDETPTTSVAAVTSGMASIGGMTIAEVADHYRALRRSQGFKPETALEVVEDFLEHVREIWEKEAYSSALNFLIAGYGPDDSKVRNFRVNVQQQKIQQQFVSSDDSVDGYGVAWDGQANNAVRLISGVDPRLRSAIEASIRARIGVYKNQVAEDVLAGLADAGIELPESFSYDLREIGGLDIPWDGGSQDINYRNLPLQTAVELTSALVNIESGMQKFAQGIPTVGGRTRIGLVRRGKKFITLNEPTLVHHHTGYHTDE